MTVIHSRQDPLSWREARAKLRGVLQDFIDKPSRRKDDQKSQDRPSFVKLWFKNNMDVYAGSFLSSLAFLVISSISLASRNTQDPIFNASAEIGVYRSQVAASVLMMAGCLFSAYLMGRRRDAAVKDSGASKRRAINKYLAAMDKMDDQQEGSIHRKEDETALSGTSLTGIFPVYRTSANGKGDWVNIPVLLLMEGDYVALQIGDIVPANCKSLESGSTLVKGHRIEKFSGKAFAGAPLPLGRSTIPSNSKALLSLCNLMKIFVVEEAPIASFLRRPPPKYRSPQVHRQLDDIRKIMYFFSVGSFLLCLLLIFVRPDITSTDLSVLLQSPFLAAMGGLPIISPIFLMLLEVLGTARILVTVHRCCSLQNSQKDIVDKSGLLRRYIFAAVSSRLSLQSVVERIHELMQMTKGEKGKDGLLPIPAASLCLLEKLGVATAFALVDDELACEKNSTPQQLLVPSSNGLKLLDICPTMEEEESYDETDSKRQARFSGSNSGGESDSEESLDDAAPNQSSASMAGIGKLRNFRKRVRLLRMAGNRATQSLSFMFERKTEENIEEVQFEDPLWWQHLPSLKCIGLACMLLDQEGPQDRVPLVSESPTIEERLIRHIAVDRHRKQFRLLGKCIGFNTEKNSFGDMGDLSPFVEVGRFQIISSRIFRERLKTDTHALGLEDSRNWGKLRTDATSVIIQDKRSKAYQLLTVGDPRVVANFCHEAWQGENSTILPLSAKDRKSTLATSDDWMLADLDVAAFSYTPLPYTLQEHFQQSHQKQSPTKKYLLENTVKDSTTSEEWSILGNQIFLGVLGSSIVPRKEIEKLLQVFGEAGVRFVYFSPRNMRRTKEVASQMGIDVAWNCAISLRPLGEGEDDQYRMKSTYADWDINAKLPHGIDQVRKHLKEVDNVPLLVSLFTDVTKENTAQMIETFQDYHDTVLAMGLSHKTRNADIFDSADLAVGVDILSDPTSTCRCSRPDEVTKGNVLSHEVDLVTSLSASACVFRLYGAASTAFMPEIIATSRAALQASSSAVSFVSTACTAYSLFVLFSMCSVSTVLPVIPALGSILFLMVMLPLVGLSMAMTDRDSQQMKEVPPKNDASVIFGKNERARVYSFALIKSLFPAIVSQLLWLISFGELMIKFEPDFVRDKCDAAASWISLVRCDDLKWYSGAARTSGGALALGELILCLLVSSSSFIHRTKTIWEEAPWRHNCIWVSSLVINAWILAAFLAVSILPSTLGALPWYFFLIAFLSPFFCLFIDEGLKLYSRRQIRRAVMMRRLQFETRLGMWSPK